MKPRAASLRKINKVGKPLAKQTDRSEKMTQDYQE